MKWFPVLLAFILFSACASEQTSDQAESAPAVEDQTGTTASTMGTAQRSGAAGGLIATVFKPGEKITLGDLEITVNGAKPNTARGGDSPEPALKAVMVSVTAANTGGEAKALHPGLFQFRGEDGAIYRPTDQGSKLFNLPKFPVFKGVDLQPGGSNIITLVFEIPRQNVFDLLFFWEGNEVTVRMGLEW